MNALKNKFNKLDLDGLKCLLLSESSFRGRKAIGYHCEGMPSSKGIIYGAKTDTNKFGVYEGKVDGKEKASNDGFSTFFPRDRSPHEVINVIDEAYDNRQYF